jgi:hypothetical protein
MAAENPITLRFDSAALTTAELIFDQAADDATDAESRNAFGLASQITARLIGLRFEISVIARQLDGGALDAVAAARCLRDALAHAARSPEVSE